MVRLESYHVNNLLGAIYNRSEHRVCITLVPSPPTRWRLIGRGGRRQEGVGWWGGRDRLQLLLLPFHVLHRVTVHHDDTHSLVQVSKHYTSKVRVPATMTDEKIRFPVTITDSKKETCKKILFYFQLHCYSGEQMVFLVIATQYTDTILLFPVTTTLNWYD